MHFDGVHSVTDTLANPRPNCSGLTHGYKHRCKFTPKRQILLIKQMFYKIACEDNKTAVSESAPSAHNQIELGRLASTSAPVWDQVAIT